MKTISNTINPKTRPKLTFQKELAFFNSINWKATTINLMADIPMIILTTTGGIAVELEINAVVMVNKINNP